MDKRIMHSPDLVARNIERIAELFPTVVTETRDEDGNVTTAIDFDLLRQELSDHIVEGPQERYRLDWPGKRASAFAANAPIAKTLRPVREESVDFDTTKNIFIEGDNLDALKLLQESYLGKVKLIYIDPPYNTGNDFIYEDDFAETVEEYLTRSGQKADGQGRLVANSESAGRFHSSWLSMMYPRLRLARNLLSDEGVLVVSIDENEYANLISLGKEVLGENSYVGEIVLKNSSKNDQKYISIQHEYIVFFVRNREVNSGDWVERKGGLDRIYEAFAGFKKKFGENWNAIHLQAKAWYSSFPASDPVYASKHYNWMDSEGVYFPDNISGPNDGQYVYDILHPVTRKVCKAPSTGWRYPEAAMKRRIEQGRVHFGADHLTIPKNKTYLKDTEYHSLASVRYVDGRSASARLEKLFGEKVFTNPKDELLLRDIYRAVGVGEGDVVLDLFAGSGSAMQAVWELGAVGAYFIGVQVAEDLHQSLKSAKGGAKKVVSNAIRLLESLGVPVVVSEVAKERMRRIGGKLREAGAGGDFGFRVFRVDSTSFADVLRPSEGMRQEVLGMFEESIKSDRTAEDLLFQVILDWGLELSLPITRDEVDGREVHDVDHGALIACFAESVTPAVVRAIADRGPLRAVFRDDAFASDAARINAEQIFRELSPGTEVRTI